MSNYLKCPYCNYDNEINDIDFGGERYTECSNCDREFVYEASINFMTSTAEGSRYHEANYAKTPHYMTEWIAEMRAKLETETDENKRIRLQKSIELDEAIIKHHNEEKQKAIVDWKKSLERNSNGQTKHCPKDCTHLDGERFDIMCIKHDVYLVWDGESETPLICDDCEEVE